MSPLRTTWTLALVLGFLLHLVTGCNTPVQPSTVVYIAVPIPTANQEPKIEPVASCPATLSPYALWAC